MGKEKPNIRYILERAVMKIIKAKSVILCFSAFWVAEAFDFPLEYSLG